MLLRRRMFGQGGGSPTIPYQRIAFLQANSNGTIPPHINCSYIPDGTEVFDIHFNVNKKSPSSQNYSILFGSRVKGTATDSSNFWTGFNSGLSAFVRFGTINPTSSLIIAENTNYHLTVDLPNRLYKIGEDSLSFSGSNIIPANQSIYLFSMNATAVLYSNGELRISSFKITKNNIVVLDFVPVRIGTTGYMYDRVSGELFGNLGTGDFILGPDIGGTDYERQYLTFEALEDSEFNIAVATEYSIDGGDTWTALAASTATPTIHAGEKILWRKSASQIYTAFGATGNFNVYGNIMSLLYKDNFINKTTIGSSQAFANLFKSNTHVISAENLILPATSIAVSGYQNMFNGCTNLIAAPKVLPNASALQYTYGQMFYGCTKLEASPTILVQTLTKNMFRETFRGCSKLKWIKHMATSIATESCYNWVMDVPSGGTFVKDANTTWGRGQGGIPGGWTIIDE